tara:strand:- start:99 stop:206 length:108 start_codon:yes stop_codon:yes gene_type:complete
VNEIVTRFARVGYDYTLGYLNGWLAGKLKVLMLTK